MKSEPRFIIRNRRDERGRIHGDPIEVVGYPALVRAVARCRAEDKDVIWFRNVRRNSYEGVGHPRCSSCGLKRRSPGHTEGSDHVLGSRKKAA